MNANESGLNVPAGPKARISSATLLQYERQSSADPVVVPETTIGLPRTKPVARSLRVPIASVQVGCGGAGVTVEVTVTVVVVGGAVA